MKRTVFLFAFTALSFSSYAQPELSTWIQNTTGVLGSHYNSGNFTPIADTAHANVQLVQYSTNNVYVHASGVPSYTIGPYLDGNPSNASNRAYVFRIPRNPMAETGTLTEPGLGQIGVWKNGVPMYNYADAQSYNNLGIWNRNAVVFELTGFDCNRGHSAPVFQGGPPPGGTLVGGSYHHHQSPSTFDQASVAISNVCNSYPSSGLYVPNASQHSPLLGYAFDGYPVYGAYAYADTNGTGGIVRMTSSYQYRNITVRTTLPDGTVLNSSDYGPPVNSSYPLGSFKEDFEYVAGSGNLDEHNGRFAVTPEYPGGTYAYYATIDSVGNSAFPYIIGLTYYGVVATDNFPPSPPSTASTNVTISEPVTDYTASGLSDAENTAVSALSVYPNPATEQVWLQLPQVISQDLSLQLYTSNGALVRDQKWAAGSISFQMNINDLDNGIYILRVMGGTPRTVRVVIAH